MIYMWNYKINERISQQNKINKQLISYKNNKYIK